MDHICHSICMSLSLYCNLCLFNRKTISCSPICEFWFSNYRTKLLFAMYKHKGQMITSVCPVLLLTPVVYFLYLRDFCSSCKNWGEMKCRKVQFVLRTKEEHLLVIWLKCVNFKCMYLVHKSVGFLGYIHHGNGFEAFVYWTNPRLQPKWIKICTGLL